jgi:hypothetical protein
MSSKPPGRLGLRAVPLLLSGLVGLAIGIVWMWPRSPDAPPPSARSTEPSQTRAAVAGIKPSPDAVSREKFMALERRLREARRSNTDLNAELAALRATTQSPAEPPDAQRALRESRLPLAAQHETTKAAGGNASGRLGQEARWFDDLVLQDAGLSESEVEEIQARWEQFEMDKLYLDDLARREGYFGRPRYQKRRQALDGDLRSDLGSEGYDAYLYATGQPNRVVIQNVLPDSPAALAGLETGDVVIEYAGDRVFSPREFKSATTRGKREDLVLIEVQRGEELMSFRSSRGPLGVRMKSISAPPTLDR